MADQLKIDEFNTVNLDSGKKWKMRSVDYDKYFGEMNLTESQKQKRIEMAEKLEERMLFVLSLIAISSEYENIDWEQINTQFQNAYFDVLKDGNVLDDYLIDYIAVASQELTNTTQNGLSETATEYDRYYVTSYDRARNIAENETNTIINHDEFEDARLLGYTMKTWETMKDKKVRDSHRDLDGQTIMLDEPFLVGNSLMLYPRDTETYGAEPEDYAGCRCTISYS